MQKYSRRQFLRTAAITGTVTPIASPSIFPSILGKVPPADSKVRLAFIGVGVRGRSHLKQALLRNDVEITAICDTSSEAVSHATAMIEKAGRKTPAVYGKREGDFRQMLTRHDIDGVIIATPWEWHVLMAIAAMEAGKYVGMEVSARATLEESWDLVNAFERTGSHYMLLENVCYQRDVLSILNMIRQGQFGKMTYAHCGYQHKLQTNEFNGRQSAGSTECGIDGYSEAYWRTHYGAEGNNALYPTHGLGPVAHWFNINRGNQFTQLTSTATKSRGFHKYVIDEGVENDSNANANFKLGDVVTTMIQCANGENIVLIHDTYSSRPYSPGFRAQGTQGSWMNDNDIICLDTPSATTTGLLSGNWAPFADYQTKYDHPLWKRHGQAAENSAQSSPDFFVLQAFIESIKHKTAPPIDVYDAAVWSAISLLSEESIAGGSKAVAIPDFTRGKWKTNKPIFCLTDSY